MELTRNTIVVAIGPHLEKIHRGYILSFKTTPFDVVQCSDLEQFIDHAQAGAALYVISADTGIPGISSDELVEKLGALDAKYDAPVLFLRDPKKPTVTAPKSSRLIMLSRWTEAREALGIKHLTAATPATKVKPPEESFLEGAEKLRAAESSDEIYIASSSSDGARARDKSSETKRFFGIKRETKADGEVEDKLIDEGPESPQQSSPTEPQPEPSTTPDAPAAPESADLGKVAAAVSDIMAQSSDDLPASASSEADERARDLALFAAKSPLAEPTYTEPLKTEPVESEIVESEKADAGRPPAKVVSTSPRPVSGLEEESIVVAPDLRPLSVSTVPPKPKKKRAARRRTSPMVYVLVGLVISIVAVIVVIAVVLSQRVGQGVIVSGPTLGTVELTGGSGSETVSASRSEEPAAGAPAADAALDEAGATVPNDGGLSGEDEEAAVEVHVDAGPEGEAADTTEFILPFKYVRSQRSPYNINHREFRKIIRFITKNRSLNFEIIGHGAPDENHSFVKRLGYQRAKEARDQICRRGPKRRRFKLRSAGASVPLEAPHLSGKELIDAHRRVVLRVIDEADEP